MKKIRKKQKTKKNKNKQVLKEKGNTLSTVEIQLCSVQLNFYH